MRTSIRSRIAWTYFLLIFVALSISGIYTVTITRLNHQNTLRLSLENQAKLTSSWVAPLLNPNDGQQTVRDTIGQTLTQASLSSSMQVAVFDTARHQLFNSADHSSNAVSSDPEVVDALNKGSGESTRPGPGAADTYLYVAVPIYADHKVIGVCSIGESLTPIEDELNLLWQRLVQGFLIIAMIAGALGVYFAQRVAWPIEEITRVTQQIAEGRLTERIRYHRKDELGEMSDSINLMASRMSEQIEDLTEQQSKLYAVLSHMESGVLLVDRASKITVANQYAESMLQADTQTILNKWHWEALHSYRLSSLIDEVVLKGQPLRRELTLLSTGERGAERVVEVSVTPIVGHLGAISGAVVVLHDISEFKRLSRMRSEFVANVSHELRTPITAVKGFAETLLDGASSDPELTKQFLTIIYQESERMTRIVSDLLELSKIEYNQSIWRFEPKVDLTDIIMTTVTTLQHQAELAGIELKTDPSVEQKALPLVELDRDRIAQVIVNLVMNAIHYTPSPGRVVVGCQDTGNGVEVWVKDTGIGIPKEDISRLFERFYRVDKARERRSGGTGLGLAIVKHIVEAHHGTCQVRSKLGEGSVFSFTLPYRVVQ